MSLDVAPVSVRIHVAGPVKDEPFEFVYSQVPIRLGRNPLNELTLEDSHVSQWHAIITYVQGALRIFDVGSRNGTRVDDRKLKVREAVPLRGGERIDIGPFSIRVSPGGQGKGLESSQMGRVRSMAGARVSANSQTANYDAEVAAEAMQAAAAASASRGQTPAYEPEKIPPLGATAHAASPRLDEIKPLYLAYLRSWASLCDDLRQRASALAPSERKELLTRVAEAFPTHAWPQEFPELLASPGAPPVIQDSAAGGAQAALESLAAFLTGRRESLSAPAKRDAFAQRLRSVMNVFLEHTHGLLKGLERLEADLEIKALGRAESPLVRARDGRDLGMRLFDLGSPGSAQAPEWLATAFKSLMIQQVALLSSAMTGVRSLLGQLAPEALEEELRSQGVRLRSLTRASQLWNAFVEKHRQLSEEDQGTFEALFGTQFSRAYAEIMGEAYEGK